MGSLSGYKYREVVAILKMFGFVFYRQAAGRQENYLEFPHVRDGVLIPNLRDSEIRHCAKRQTVMGKRIKTTASLLATLIRMEYICSNKEHNNYTQEQYFDNNQCDYPNNIFRS